MSLFGNHFKPEIEFLVELWYEISASLEQWNLINNLIVSIIKRNKINTE